jgi:hypothetical protein
MSGLISAMVQMLCRTGGGCIAMSITITNEQQAMMAYQITANDSGIESFFSSCISISNSFTCRLRHRLI